MGTGHGRALTGAELRMSATTSKVAFIAIVTCTHDAQSIGQFLSKIKL